MKLVIVESPAKAKTIEHYLGHDYKVLASYGHIRDLPPKNGSIDPENEFNMLWENYSNKTKQIKAIEQAVKSADELILATDPDREGEAISWHIKDWLKSKRLLPDKTVRVTFNAITKDVVTTAMKHPRDLDYNLIDAYLARRGLDYLVGFTLSPVLWRKLPGAKSAGRVQSVALRMVVNKEREIEAFKADEYWSVDALLEKDRTEFLSKLVKWNNNKLNKLSIPTEEEANKAKLDVENSQFTVTSVVKKPVTRNPQPPFTTSTLQQDASHKLGFSASHTMRLAQTLYESGLITYMRTDGVQMEESALNAVRNTIKSKFGNEYIPAQPRVYHVKAKNAQEAHEPIRPTDFSKSSASFGDQAKLYELIWKRAVASQMSSARLEQTTVELEDKDHLHTLRSTGQIVLFPGFLVLYDTDTEKNDRLPSISVGDAPRKKEVIIQQHYTQPPARFSEASLVKNMEVLGIGRPSTYASIIQVLKDRQYVTVEKGRFIPSSAGRLLVAFLERFFTEYVNYDFTASLEDKLDQVSNGSNSKLNVLDSFWKDFKPRTAEVMELQPSGVFDDLDKFLEPWLFPVTEEGKDPRECPKCHTGRLSLRGGRFGSYISCSNYPECKYTRQLDKNSSSDISQEPKLLGERETLPVTLRQGKFGPYIQQGEGKDAKRVSIPKGIKLEDVDFKIADMLLSLPRPVGFYEDTDKEIVASIGRFGPYLNCDGRYARLSSIEEMMNISLEEANVKLKQAFNRPETTFHRKSFKKRS